MTAHGKPDRCPSDVCECGEYRSQHDNDGPCKAPYGGCIKFRFSRAATVAERQRSLYDALMTWHAAHSSGTVSPLDGSVGNTTITLSSLHHRATTADKSVEYSLSSSAKVSGQAEQRLRALRENGWMVAVHNDYRLNGKFHTFWLLTRGDRFIKGEGETDDAALAEAALQESPSDKDAKKGLL